MVSLLSFFTGKRKSRRAPSPPSSTAPHAQTSQTSRPRPTSRFLSLRQKKNPGRPADIATRRASTEGQLQRKRSGTRKKSSSIDLPRLALGWEADGATQEILGLELVGKPPQLTEAEKRLVQEQRWDVPTATTAVRLFGDGLKTTGLETPGILLPQPRNSDKENQFRLLALFALSQDRSLLDNFTSFISQYPQPTVEPDMTINVWEDRLLSAMKDTTNPFDHVECLKAILRRLDISESNTNLIDNETYQTSLIMERDAKYPMDAFERLFAPRLPPSTVNLLEGVFDLWGTVVAHSDANEITSEMVTRLMGVFVLGSLKSSEWTGLYSQWKDASRRAEHLFYMWIRNQSTKHVLPTKLTQLVEDYPFGQLDDSLEVVARSSHHPVVRRTLHIKLSSSAPLSKDISASSVLSDCMRAKVEEGSRLPLWISMNHEKPSALHDLLDDQSLAFLSNNEVTFHEPAEPIDPTSASPTSEESSIAKDSMYRPFSVSLGPPISPQHVRRRSQSYGDLQPSPHHVSPTKESSVPILESPSGSTSPRLARQSSMNLCQSSSSNETEVWESFLASGFGDAPKQELELSPSSAESVPRVSTTTRAVSFGPRNTESSKALAPSTHKCEYFLVQEAVVELDDMFMLFVRDGMSDPATTSAWPPFALSGLRCPIFHDGGDINWLLVTVEYRAPVREVKRTSPTIERSTSPAQSTTRSLGFFRRSSSFSIKTSSHRRSLFSKLSPQHSASSGALPTLAESSSSKTFATQVISAISATSTEYTTTEMGEMVKIPPEKVANVEEIFNPVGDTSASDWVYRAEGRAHLIFTYTGSAPTYFRRILRIRKPTFPVDSEEEADVVWKEELLPQLLPPELLLTSRKVELEKAWAEMLLEAAEKVRPAGRKVESGSLVDALKGNVTGSIMDDTTAVGTGAETIFAIEIKPKWGFLPRKENISPPEAAEIKGDISRYVLHRHFKSHGTEDDYDPLDLFSDDETRQTEALRALWAIWESTEGAKNSWRVYVDGKPVSPAERGIIPTANNEGTLAESTAPFILPALNGSNVLSKLKRVQSTLDPIDISSLAAMFEKVYPDKALFDRSIATEPIAKELETFVHKYVQAPDGGLSGTWSLREHMIAYALSAIFKDCSLFITLPLTKYVGTGTWTLKPGAKVKVIDLDLKSVGSLKKWYDLDEAIWRHWHETKVQSSVVAGQSSWKATAVKADDGKFEGQASPIETHEVGHSVVPTTEVQASTPPIDGRITPSRSHNRPSALLAPRTPEGITFADALAISPSKPAFDSGRTRPSLDPLSDTAGLKLNGLLSTPSASNEAAEDDLQPETQAIAVTLDAEKAHKSSADDGMLETHAIDFDTAAPTDTDQLEDPDESREKRSFAPSPSPTPFTRDLPEDLEELLMAPTSSPPSHSVAAERSSQIVATANESEEESQCTAALPQSPLKELDTQAEVAVMAKSEPNHDVPSGPVMPESIEMLRDDSREQSAGVIESGSSTPYQEFLTPMTDIHEPVLRNRPMQSGSTQGTVINNAIEDIPVQITHTQAIDDDKTPVEGVTSDAADTSAISPSEDSKNDESTVDVSDRTFGTLDDTEDDVERPSLSQILLGAPIASIPQLFAKEALEEFSHLDDDKPQASANGSHQEPAMIDQSIEHSEAGSYVPLLPHMTADTQAMPMSEEDPHDLAASLGRLAFASPQPSSPEVPAVGGPLHAASPNADHSQYSQSEATIEAIHAGSVLQSVASTQADSASSSLSGTANTIAGIPGPQVDEDSHTAGSPLSISQAIESERQVQDAPHEMSMFERPQGGDQLSDLAVNSQSTAATVQLDKKLLMPSVAGVARSQPETPGLMTDDSSINDDSALNTPVREELQPFTVISTQTPQHVAAHTTTGNPDYVAESDTDTPTPPHNPPGPPA